MIKNQDKTFCQVCGGEITGGEHDFEIETANCIFHLCLGCNTDIESEIEDKMKYYKNGEEK